MILCHSCKWGATPGYLKQCCCPGIPTDLTDLRTKAHGSMHTETSAAADLRAHGEAASEKTEEFNPAAWALPSIAAATGECVYYTPTFTPTFTPKTSQNPT